MYFRSFLATLFLAGAVVAGPIRQADRGLGSTVGSVTGNLDGNKAEGNGNVSTTDIWLENLQSACDLTATLSKAYQQV